MLKQRRMAAEQIAGALFEAEAAIDAALAKTAHLTGVMPSLRQMAGASALVGQDAVERASQAIMALAEARRAIVETHKELSVAQGQVGLGAVRMGGDGGEKPPPTAMESQQPGLRRLRIAS
jgi:aspartate/methionine/tyrosine aminotransferase